jgi:type IV fimbrial biogenesis protein FimT
MPGRRANAPRIRGQRGFTLVEALIVMTVLGIVIATAVPSLADFGRNQRIRATSFDLVADLLLARSEAIKRAAPVTLVGAGSGWQDGWTVRVDGGLHVGTVLQRRAGPGHGVAVSGADSVGFDRDGRLAGGGTARIAVGDSVASAVRRCIEVDLGGMARSRTGSCS